MHGHVAALARHPVKGFTPEPLGRAELAADAPFPQDRLYALECGPSGFDPQAPGHVPKMKLAALAPLPVLARIATALGQDGLWRASAPATAPYVGRLDYARDRDAFAAWTQAYLDRAAPGAARGRLKMLEAPGHRFFDDPAGLVSLINLASVRDLAQRAQTHIDPARFRANIAVEGWPPWTEAKLRAGAAIKLGEARLIVVKPIQRCIAVHVDPRTGERDLDVCSFLHVQRGNADCGLYLRVEHGGGVALDDPAQVAA